MITEEEIMAIINKHDERYQKFLKRKPKTLSLKILKRELDFWTFQVVGARELEKKNTSRFFEDLRFVWFFLNVFSTVRIHSFVALFYIKRLEEEFEKLKPEKTEKY